MNADCCFLLGDDVLTASSAIEQIVSQMKHDVQDWSTILVGFVGPITVLSCLCSLLLTNHRLPASRFNWLTRMAATIRRHPLTVLSTNHYTVSATGKLGYALRLYFSAKGQLESGLRFFFSSLSLPFRGMVEDAQYGRDLAHRKENQFGRGEPNFNAMAFWLAGLPMLLGVLCYIPVGLKYADLSAIELGLNMTKQRVESISYLFGWGSCMCLAFFLIPVTRHSVLLAAMGWSPIHALRIHIWFGYLSFVFMLVHGMMLVPVWFIYYPFPVYQQIVPDRKCWTWTWTEETENDIEPSCYHVFANWTGIVAAVFFTVLWGSSLNWVRRRNYRLFYILHIIFGILTLLGIILHMYWFVIYFLPSITYYLASTTPTLVQALASRFRGGVKIRKVVLVEESGGCVEVHIEAHETARSVLDREPCQFIKLCVPQISLIWHPFDVYKSYSVDGTPDDTVRFLFRPVGPFTKELAKHLTSSIERPITLVDGFYLGSNKTELAMQHDCVTMIAGGVALSPYLTLIPAMLNKIAIMSSKGFGTVKTTSIALHWVCREPGLREYYVSNYLNTMVKRARALHFDVNLSIYVYLTGDNKNKNATVALPDVNKALEDKEPTIVDAHCASPSAADDTKDELDSGTSDREGKNSTKNDSEDGTADGAVVIADPLNNSRGHPLELARMLPRRYSNAIWNLPIFIFFSGANFLGLWYLFNKNPHDPMNYYDLSKATWITLYAVFMYIVLGVLAEACVLGLRKYWPQPFPDQFEIISGRPMYETDKNDHDYIKDVDEEGNNNKGVTFVYRHGRPTCDQLFEDARQAAEPGIFMCGPSALTHMVKAEASKENSYLGLTRYCLYDEPYEM
jgi:Ferric reductase like transmembrane component/Ferric reductase NAD binding domain